VNFGGRGYKTSWTDTSGWVFFCFFRGKDGGDHFFSLGGVQNIRGSIEGRGSKISTLKNQEKRGKTQGGKKMWGGHSGCTVQT